MDLVGLVWIARVTGALTDEAKLIEATVSSLIGDPRLRDGGIGTSIVALVLSSTGIAVALTCAGPLVEDIAVAAVVFLAVDMVRRRMSTVRLDDRMFLD